MSSAFELYRNIKRLLEDLDHGRIQEAQEHLGTERLVVTLRDLSDEICAAYQFEPTSHAGELPAPSSSWGNVVYPLANLLGVDNRVAVTVVKHYVSHSLKHEDLIEATKVSPNEVWDFYENLCVVRIACVTNLIRLQWKLNLLVRGLLRGDEERDRLKENTRELVQWIEGNIDNSTFQHLRHGLDNALQVNVPGHLPPELRETWIANCFKKQALLLEAILVRKSLKGSRIPCKVMANYLSKRYVSYKERHVNLPERATYFSQRADNSVVLLFIDYLQFDKFDQVERERAKDQPDRDAIKMILTSPRSPGSPKNYKAIQNEIVAISKKFERQVPDSEVRLYSMIIFAWAVFLDRWSSFLESEELFPPQEIAAVRDSCFRACDMAVQGGVFRRLDDLLSQSKCDIVDQEVENVDVNDARALVQGLMQAFFRTRLVTVVWQKVDELGQRPLYYKVFCEATRGSIKTDLISMQRGLLWEEAKARFPMDLSLLKMLTSVLSAGDPEFVVDLVLGSLRECTALTVPKDSRVCRCIRGANGQLVTTGEIVCNGLQIPARTVVRDVSCNGKPFGRSFEIRYSVLPFLMDKLDNLSRLRPSQQHNSIVEEHLEHASVVLDFLQTLFAVPDKRTYSRLALYLDDASRDPRQRLPRQSSVVGLLVNAVRALSLLVDGSRSYVGQVYELLKTSLLVLENLLLQNRHTRELCTHLIAHESQHGEPFAAVLERIFRDVELHSGRFCCTISSLKIVEFLIRTRISNAFVDKTDEYAFIFRLLQLPHEVFGQYDSLQYVESKHRAGLTRLSLACFNASLRSNESLLPDAPTSIRKIVFEHFVTRKSLLSQLMKSIFLGSEDLSRLQFSSRFLECSEVEATIAAALDLLNTLLRNRCMVYEHTDATIPSQHSALNMTQSTSHHGALVVVTSNGGSIVPFTGDRHNASMNSTGVANRSAIESAAAAAENVTDPRAFEKSLLYYQEEATEKVQFLSALVALSNYEPHHLFYRSSLPQRVFKCFRLLTVNSVSRTSGASLYSLPMFLSKVELRVLFFSAMHALDLFSNRAAGIEVLTWIQESLRSQPTIADYLISSVKRKNDGSTTSLERVFHTVLKVASAEDRPAAMQLVSDWAPFLAQVCSLLRQMWIGANSAGQAFVKKLVEHQKDALHNLMMHGTQSRLDDPPAQLYGTYKPDQEHHCSTLEQWMGYCGVNRNLIDLLSYLWQQKDRDQENDNAWLFEHLTNPPDVSMDRWEEQVIRGMLGFSTYEATPWLREIADKHGISFQHCFTAQCASDPVVDVTQNHIDLEEARIFAEAQRSSDASGGDSGSGDSDQDTQMGTSSGSGGLSSYILPPQKTRLISDSVCEQLLEAARADVWKRFSAETRESVLASNAHFLALLVDKLPATLGFLSSGSDDMLKCFPGDFINLLIEKMQEMFDILPADGALLHAATSRCLELCELFLRKLYDLPGNLHPALSYRNVCSWLQSFVRLLQNPKFMPKSLTAKRYNDERHELYDLVMERVSRTYENVIVLLAALEKAHGFATVDGASGAGQAELTTFFHCGEILKCLCSHMQHRRVVILAPELISVLLHSGLTANKIIEALETSNAIEYFFAPILRPTENDAIELNASLEFLADLAQNNDTVAQALVGHGIVTSLCNSPVFMNVQRSGTPHTVDGERNPWHIAWLAALRLVAVLLRSPAFTHAFYFFSMYKVRLLGRLTLPDNPQSAGGHLSKPELDEMLAIASMLSTMFQRDAHWAPQNPELHTAALHVVTHLFEGCVKLAVHPRALKKRVWPITKDEKLSSGVSLGVRFDETTAFGTGTHGGVFSEGQNQFGLSTAQFGEGFETESSESQDQTQPSQPGLLSSGGLMSGDRLGSGGLGSGGILGTPSRGGGLGSALSAARSGDDEYGEDDMKHGGPVTPRAGYPTPGAPSPMTQRRRPSSPPPPLPRPESPLIGVNSHDRSVTYDKTVFWNECEALLNCIIAECLRCLRVPMERLKNAKGCDYNHKRSLFSPQTPANFWKLVDPAPVGVQPSWVVLSQCGVYALKTIRNIQRDYDEDKASNAERLLFVFDHCVVMLVAQLTHYINTPNTFEFMSSKNRTRLLDAVSKFDGLFRDFMKPDRQRQPPIASQSHEFYKLKYKQWCDQVMSDKGLKKHDTNARLARTSDKVDLYG